jgi:hypothetical protein
MSNSDTLKHSPGTWTGLFAFKSRVVGKPEVIRDPSGDVSAFGFSSYELATMVMRVRQQVDPTCAGPEAVKKPPPTSLVRAV